MQKTGKRLLDYSRILKLIGFDLQNHGQCMTVWSTSMT